MCKSPFLTSPFKFLETGDKPVSNQNDWGSDITTDKSLYSASALNSSDHSESDFEVLGVVRSNQSMVKANPLYQNGVIGL